MAKTRAKNQGMTGREIKAELIRRGVKLSDIAKMAGVSPPAVTKALTDGSSYIGMRIRPYIAEAVGMSVEKIWPPVEKQKLAR